MAADATAAPVGPKTTCSTTAASGVSMERLFLYHMTCATGHCLCRGTADHPVDGEQWAGREACCTQCFGGAQLLELCHAALHGADAEQWAGGGAFSPQSLPGCGALTWVMPHCSMPRCKNLFRPLRDSSSAGADGRSCAAAPVLSHMTCAAGFAEGHVASAGALQPSLLMPADGQGMARIDRLAAGSELCQAALQAEQSST